MLTELGQRPRDIQHEFMGRGILAGVVAVAAIVAEVGQVVQVLTCKDPSELHGGKHRTESLTVAAGIADRHHPLSFL
jgi:hypothetical protein